MLLLRESATGGELYIQDGVSMIGRTFVIATTSAFVAIVLVACGAIGGEGKEVGDRMGPDAAQSWSLSGVLQMPPEWAVPNNAPACKLTTPEEVGATVGDTVIGSNGFPYLCNFYFGEGAASRVHMVTFATRVFGSHYTDAEYKQSTFGKYGITDATEIDNLGTVAYCGELPPGEISNPANIWPVPVTWIRVYTDRGNGGKYGYGSFEMEAYSSSCDQLTPLARAIFGRIPYSWDDWE